MAKVPPRLKEIGVELDFHVGDEWKEDEVDVLIGKMRVMVDWERFVALEEVTQQFNGLELALDAVEAEIKE